MSDELFFQNDNFSNIIQKNWKLLQFKLLKVNQEHSRYPTTMNN